MRGLQYALFAAVAVIGSGSIAAAADLPVKAGPVWAAPATGPLWEGIYAGANVGGAWTKSTWCTDAAALNCETAGRQDIIHSSSSAWVGGGQFGDRWQTGNFVYGVEGMIDGLTASSTTADSINRGQVGITKYSGLMSVTGQVGLAFDRFLAYGKGGWALTDMKFQANNAPGGANLYASEFVNGWTVGGGLEYQVIPHLIVGIEYDYYRFEPGNLGNLTNSLGNTVNCGFCNFGSSTNIQTVMARISLQAGPPPALH